MRALWRRSPVSLFLAMCAFGVLPAAEAPLAAKPSPRPCTGCDAPIHPVLRSRNPELIPSSKVEPRYPRRARHQKVEGQVILQCLIRRDGTVGDVNVLKVTAPGYGLEAAAKKAVRRWRFVPATFNDESFDVYFTLVVDFRLDERPGSAGEVMVMPPPSRSPRATRTRPHFYAPPSATASTSETTSCPSTSTATSRSSSILQAPHSGSWPNSCAR